VDEEKREGDLGDIIREEESRGRQPYDAETARQLKYRIEQLRELIELRDLDAALNVLRDRGWTEAELDEFVQLWNQILP
jgi:hypothetical protein